MTKNEKNANREHTEKNCDNYLTIERLNNLSVEYVQEQDRQTIKILEKAQLCLKISLYRLDSLMHEAENKLTEQEQSSQVTSLLMNYRLKVHTMIDENIKQVTELSKKLK